jgi:eukaryotic-like serine/threonine-protein kinase
MIAPKTILQNRYQIISRIGQGGMGSVYKAIDTRLHATVALKETLFTDSSMQKAFEREAKLLARLRHQALPKVIDYFFEGNGQFLVMEYVDGDDMATRMERSGGGFPPDKIVPWVLRWADQLLGALEYLHEQEPPAIHRDIKPQNLKLTPRGEIILLDFGLARGGLGDVSTVTSRGNVEGYTPNYAPLEQIRGSEPDPRSDLYSLAATLYHFLTGQKPPDALTRAASLLNSQPDPLRPANELNTHVPWSVASVLHGTMSLNPENRPTNASIMRKALKEVRYNQQAAGAAGPTQQLGTPGSPVITQNLHVSAQHLTVTGPASEQESKASSTSRLKFSEPAGSLLRTVTTGSQILSVAFSPDGQTVAAAGEDNAIGVWMIEDGRLLCSLEGHTNPARSIAFSPDGKYLVSGSGDGTIRLWFVEDGAELYQAELDPIESVAFSPDGALIAAGGWGDAVSLFQVHDNVLEKVADLSASFVHSVAFSPDSTMLAAGCYDTTIRLWLLEGDEWNEQKSLEGHTNFVLTVAFSPDGQLLASGGGGTTVRLWRTRDGRQIDTFDGHANFIHSVAFNPAGMMLATGSADNTVRLWRVEDSAVLHTLGEHVSGVTSIAFSPDGYFLLSGSRDAKMRLWQARGADD